MAVAHSPRGVITRRDGETFTPDVVVYPRHAEDVAKALQHAQAHGMRVGVVGGGTAERPPALMALDSKGLRGVHIDRERGVAVLGAGEWAGDTERALLAAGFTSGHDPTSLEVSTVGGLAATDAIGTLAPRYGSFKEAVVGVRGATPAGGPFQSGTGFASRTAPEGPALADLMGHRGGNAVVTEVAVRIWPAPTRRWMRLYSFSEAAAALQACRLVIQGGLDPACLRVMATVTPRQERGRVRGIARRTRRSAAFKVPTLLDSLEGSLSRHIVVAAVWEGAPEVVDDAASIGHRLLSQQGEDLGLPPAAAWWNARHDVAYGAAPIFAKGGFVGGVNLACRWSAARGLLRALREQLAKGGGGAMELVHADSLGCRWHVGFAGKGGWEEWTQTRDRLARSAADAEGIVLRPTRSEAWSPVWDPQKVLPSPIVDTVRVSPRGVWQPQDGAAPRSLGMARWPDSPTDSAWASCWPWERAIAGVAVQEKHHYELALAGAMGAGLPDGRVRLRDGRPDAVWWTSQPSGKAWSRAFDVNDPEAAACWILDLGYHPDVLTSTPTGFAVVLRGRAALARGRRLVARFGEGTAWDGVEGRRLGRRGGQL